MIWLYHLNVVKPLALDINVTGTSSGKSSSTVVASLKCSSACQDITATGTHLTSPAGNATYVCQDIVSIKEVRVIPLTEGLYKVCV